MGATKAPDHRGAAGLKSDRKTTVLFVGGVLLVVLGLVAAVVATVFIGRDQSASPGAEPSASASGQSTAGEPSDPVATAPPGGVQTGVPSVDGLVVTAVVVSSISIEVVETVRWPDGGPAMIELALLEGAAAAGGLAITAEPTVRSLQVSVDGSAVVPTRLVGSPNAWVITAPAGEPTSMEVRYVLAGAVVRSVPARPGRALAVLTPISAEATGDLPIAISIAAANVLNVFCPTAATPAAIMCGRLDGDAWTVAAPSGLPLVVAQLDLPELT